MSARAAIIFAAMRKIQMHARSAARLDKARLSRAASPVGRTPSYGAGGLGFDSRLLN